MEMSFNDFEKYCFGLLQDAFLDLCEDYVEIVNDMDGKNMKVERLSKQATTYFSIQPECLEDLLCKLNRQHIKPEADRESTEGQSDVEHTANTQAQIKSVEEGERDEKTVEEENFKIQEAEKIIALNSDESDESNGREHLKDDIMEDVNDDIDSENESTNHTEIVPENDSIENKDSIDEIECNQLTEQGETIGNDAVNDNLMNDEEIIKNDVVVEDSQSPFQFSDFAKQSKEVHSPKHSESDNSDTEVERAQKSINSFEKKIEEKKQDSQDFKNESQTLEENNLPPRTQGDGMENTPKRPNIFNQFKNQKTVHSMPPKTVRKNPFIQRQQSSMSRHPVDPEIEKQRTNSLMKDSEAQLSVWNELVCLMLHLLASLNDEEFKVQ